MTLNRSALQEELDAFLSTEYRIEEYGELFVLSTPFTDVHNDLIEVALVPGEGSLRITDSGETIADFAMSGYRMTDARRRRIDQILARFNLHLDHGEIWCSVTDQGVGEAVQRMLQALSNIQEIYPVNPEPSLTGREIADVVGKSLHSSGLSYAGDVRLRGRSAIEHHADFVIERSNSYPDCIVSTVANLDLAAAERQAFFAIDTREEYAREVGSDPAYLALYYVATSSAKKPLEQYGVTMLSYDKADLIDWRDFLAHSCGVLDNQQTQGIHQLALMI